MVPIISTIPDGGYNLNPCILFSGDKDVKVADKIVIDVEKHESQYYNLLAPRWKSYYYDVGLGKEDLVDQKKEDETINDTSLEGDMIGDGFPLDNWVDPDRSYYEAPTVSEIFGEIAKNIKNEFNEFFKNLWSGRY